MSRGRPPYPTGDLGTDRAVARRSSRSSRPSLEVVAAVAILAVAVALAFLVIALAW